MFDIWVWHELPMHGHVCKRNSPHRPIASASPRWSRILFDFSTVNHSLNALSANRADTSFGFCSILSSSEQIPGSELALLCPCYHCSTIGSPLPLSSASTETP